MDEKNAQRVEVKNMPMCDGIHVYHMRYGILVHMATNKWNVDTDPDGVHIFPAPDEA